MPSSCAVVFKVVMATAVAVIGIQANGLNAVREYCVHESFNATCPQGHLILVTSAVYGRMRGGRCVSSDAGHMGCKADVMPMFDEHCSGRTSCVVQVRDLIEVRPCLKDYSSYLEASYECIKVQNHSQKCGKDKSILINATTPGYLSPVGMGRNHVAMATCPWRIEVPPGQKVNLTLMDFMAEARRKGTYTGESHKFACDGKLVLLEGKDTNQEMSTCAGTSRHRHIYTSVGNSLLIYLDATTIETAGGVRQTPQYIVRYDAIGCADPEVPSDTWMRRVGDNLVVRCNDTQETWYLTCQENRWIGEVGNCSQASSVLHSNEMRHNSGIFPPHGIVLAVLIGVVLGVFIGSIMLLTVHCVRKKNRRDAKRERDASRLMQKEPPEGQQGQGTRLTDSSNYPALLMDVETHIEMDKQYVDYNAADFIQCTCGNHSDYPAEQAELTLLNSNTLPMHTFNVTRAAAATDKNGLERPGVYERPLYPPGMRTPGEPPSVYFELDKGRARKSSSLPRHLQTQLYGEHVPVTRPDVQMDRRA